MMDLWSHTVLPWLTLPEHSLIGVFVVGFLAATLLPLGSEPVVLGAIYLHPDLLWAIVLLATVGNTAGGCCNWYLGYLARRWRRSAPAQTSATTERRLTRWLQRYGARVCVLAWVPVIGDPLCCVAGWLGLPLWSCAAWMALGKGLRYLFISGALQGLLSLA